MVDAASGYVVLTWEDGRGWKDDWDGEVHMNLEAGKRALTACAQTGYRCVLSRLVVELYGSIGEGPIEGAPTPGVLWRQAHDESGGDADARGRRYQELMRQHGHIVLRVPGEDRNLPCGWPGSDSRGDEVGNRG